MSVLVSSIGKVSYYQIRDLWFKPLHKKSIGIYERLRLRPNLLKLKGLAYPTQSGGVMLMPLKSRGSINVIASGPTFHLFPFQL